MPYAAAEPSIDARATTAPGGDPLEGSSYRSIRRLGAGGMGEVLEAEHRALGHRVVVKVLRDELAVRRDMLDRMRVEAQALARIRHPHLVMVTDFGHARSGLPFIVMELLTGMSLRDALCARAALPVAEAAEIGRQILLGLSAAHAAGLVHRDIKPDNVFLCATEDRRPFVKVLDFGIVKIAQAGRDPRTPDPLLVPTADNVLLGTPRWFSPEQARGARDIDARSDLYSVGLVLYTMVVGHGPFDHLQRWEEVLRAHTSDRVLPPSAAAPHVPEAFDRIVLRALAQAREERFPDAMVFARALSRFLDSLGAESERYRGARGRSEAEEDTIEMEEGSRPDDSPSPPGTVRLPVAAEGPTWPASPAAMAGPEDPTVKAIPAVAAGPEDPTVTAIPAVPKDDLRTTGDKLPGRPVVIDNLVERVLGIASPGLPPPAKQAEPPSPTGPALAASAPAPSNPGRASRPSIPETAPMFEVGQTAPMPHGPYPAAPAQAARPSTPSAPVDARPPLAPVPAAPAGAAWRVPVLIGAAVLLVALGVLLGYLLR